MIFVPFTNFCHFKNITLISESFSPKFQLPPPRRELPSPRLLRKAFLLPEAENIEDYRAQIMSTFGKVLKYDSTKKVHLCVN